MAFKYEDVMVALPHNVKIPHHHILQSILTIIRSGGGGGVWGWGCSSYRHGNKLPLAVRLVHHLSRCEASLVADVDHRARAPLQHRDHQLGESCDNENRTKT